MLNTYTSVRYGTDEALAFLEGHGTDAAGRTIEDYLTFDNDKWEECHDHIQWAFPSNIASMFNPTAPVVDLAELSERITSNGLTNLFLLVGKYLTSLGFKDVDGNWTFCPDSPRVEYWISPDNHNYRRISRLLNLLHSVDREYALELLNEFNEAAMHAYNIPGPLMGPNMRVRVRTIDVPTVLYWSKAATKGLNP